MSEALNPKDFALWSNGITSIIELATKQAAEIASLRAERDAMKADAERYRWLRNVNPKGEIIFDHSKEEKGVFVLYIPFDGEPIENDAEMVIRMDAAIDAAKEQGK